MIFLKHMYILNLFWLVACNQGSTVQDITVTNQDTVKKDIPTRKQSQSYRQLAQQIESKLGLYSIENGFDSLEIRVWLGYAGSNNEQLLIIKKDTDRWTANLSHLTFIYSDKGDSIQAISKTSVEKSPKSGWYQLLDSLNKLEIVTLRDMADIPNYETATDGSTITVEIAAKRQYRIYSYQNPYYMQSEFNDAKKIEQVIQFLEREFDFKTLDKI
jgi:hypothetical protein